MRIDWSTVFDNFGIKTVSSTDKSRSAYVPNEDQRLALAAAGKSPEDRETFSVDVLMDPLTTSVSTSYYNSLRQGSGRQPEARIGRGLIRWVQVGDRLILGNRGSQILVAKMPSKKALASDIGGELARKGNREKIIARAKQASGKPARRTRKVDDFVRNPYVVAAALLRADEACEMPACTRRLFRRDDGSNFLEVHHIIPLADEGDDTLVNTAALCPMCHRELHFGRKRVKRRAQLAAAITVKPIA
jgi:hypothetical protein